MTNSPFFIWKVWRTQEDIFDVVTTLSHNFNFFTKSHDFNQTIYSYIFTEIGMLRPAWLLYCTMCSSTCFEQLCSSSSSDLFNSGMQNLTINVLKVKSLPLFHLYKSISCACALEMKLFCRYIGGLSAGHVSYSLGRLKYIAIYRIHSAGSNIYRNISDAIDFESNNNFHRSNLSIIFHFFTFF